MLSYDTLVWYNSKGKKEEQTMGFIRGCIYNINNKKAAMIIAALVVAIVVAFVVFAAIKPSGEGEGPEQVSATVDTVHMEQTLTAAGKVTTGKTQTVSLARGKTLSVVCVQKKEAVKQGQALVYYTDGTHTDAPVDCIITGVHVPNNRGTVGDSHAISFNNTDALYLKVTVPEDQINNIKKGDTAEIVINAKPHQKYYGEIIDKKDISTTLLAEKKQSAAEEESQKEDENAEDDSDASEEELDESEDDEEELEEEDEGEGYDDEAEEGQEEGAYYAVNIRFVNDGTIRPGMSASCIITISSRDDVLAVPIEAVYFDEDGNPFVKKENGNGIEEVSVKIGASDAMNVEIKEGLKKGDTIKYDQY